MYTIYCEDLSISEHCSSGIIDLFGCLDIISDISLAFHVMYCSLVWSIALGLGQLMWTAPPHPPSQWHGVVPTVQRKPHS